MKDLNITTLDWDSDFFGLKIGKVEVPFQEIPSSFFDTEPFKDWDLVYIFSSQRINYNKPDHLDGELMDIKLTFEYTFQTSDIGNVDLHIKECTTLSDDINKLGLLSGHKSRFKKDKKFKSGLFEKLYLKWVENSINGTIADIVLGYQTQNKTIGFVTLRKKNETAEIGLIAVDSEFSKKGIGTSLINAAKNYCIKNNLTKLIVVTQEDNAEACKFYLKNGFKLIKREFIYHKWIKKN